MFEPKYTITPKLLGNIKHISVLIAELNNKRFSDIVLVDFERRAREISAHSSTSIEGNPLPLTEVKRLLKEAPEHARDSEREVLNYNRALVDLHTLMLTGEAKLTISLILKIHATIMDGLIEKFRIGQIRAEPVFVIDPRTRKTMYLPPDHQDVVILLNELINFIRKGDHDPVIAAGVFHKQFVIIHPFMDGNGRTTRLATKLLLAGMGLDTFNLFSFENFYNNNVSKYFQNVGLDGNYYDLKESVDFTAWLEYFSDGIIDELVRVSAELAKVGATPASKLQPYHQKILDYIQTNGFITDADYAKMTERSKASRNLDFRKLIALGLIEKRDQGKKTHYVKQNL